MVVGCESFGIGCNELIDGFGNGFEHAAEYPLWHQSKWAGQNPIRSCPVTVLDIVVRRFYNTYLAVIPQHRSQDHIQDAGLYPRIQSFSHVYQRVLLLFLPRFIGNYLNQPW